MEKGQGKVIAFISSNLKLEGMIRTGNSMPIATANQQWKASI